MTERGRQRDLVLVGGDIRTMSPGRPTASGVVCSSGVVTAVGDDSVRNVAPRGSRIVELGGRTVLPGIDDSHLHLTAHALFRTAYLDVTEGRAASWEAMAALVGTTAPGADGWVRAWGWDAAALPRLPGGNPDRGLLDSVRDDVPAVVFDRTGHQALVNTAALARVGVSADAPDPAGGVVVRDATGAPTGLLREAAVGSLAGALPPLPRSALRKALREVQGSLHAYGITAVTEPGLGPGGASLLDGSCTVDALDALGELAAEDALRLRVSVLLLFAGTGGGTARAVEAGVASGLQHRLDGIGVDPRTLRILGVKVFADGIPRSGTAWLAEPYAHALGRGSLTLAGNTDVERVAELTGSIRAIHAAGLQAGVHAIGDAAASAVVDAVAAAQQSFPRPDARHYVIHGDLMAPALLPRAAGLGMGLTANPAIRWAAGDIVPSVLGEQRYRRHQPLGAAIAAGLPTALSSDAPVTEPDWRRSVWAAVTRATRDRSAASTGGYSIDLDTALRAHTAVPAWLSQSDRWRGTIAPGMAADLCVLGDRLTDVDQLLCLPVVMTVLGGDVVYDMLR